MKLLYQIYSFDNGHEDNNGDVHHTERDSNYGDYYDVLLCPSNVDRVLSYYNNQFQT